jgi:hypothetical protein
MPRGGLADPVERGYPVTFFQLKEMAELEVRASKTRVSGFHPRRQRFN